MPFREIYSADSQLFSQLPCTLVTTQSFNLTFKASLQVSVHPPQRLMLPILWLTLLSHALSSCYAHLRASYIKQEVWRTTPSCSGHCEPWKVTFLKSECGLILQRTRVWFLAPKWQLTTTSFQGIWCPLLASKGSGTHGAHTCVQMKHTHNVRPQINCSWMSTKHCYWATGRKLKVKYSLEHRNQKKWSKPCGSTSLSHCQRITGAGNSL